MPFTIRTEDDLPTQGFDIGELVLTAPKTGKTITPQPVKKCYMIYVELSVLLDQAATSTVRRQSFWNQELPKLRESLAHLVGLIMRRAGGDASVALRVSFV